MNEQQAVQSLAALAQRQRLRIVRALVVAGQEGLTPSALAGQLSVVPSSLSFHLKELAHSGLVDAEPRGRHLVYRARLDAMHALVQYLTHQCCQGAPCALNDSLPITLSGATA